MKIDLWKIGFVILLIGIGIPLGIAIYEFALADLEWYWTLSVTLVVLGIIILTVSAIKDRLKSSKPEEKV